MFLFDLTHHSWEPNLVGKTKFLIILPDMKSERFVSEICLKCAVLVFHPCTSEAEVRMVGLRKPNHRERGAESKYHESSQGILNIYRLPNSLAKPPENDVISRSPMKTRSTTGFEPTGFYLGQQPKRYR